MVISEAGNDPKVAGLVYVAAIVPDENQSANDVLKPYPPPPGLAEAKPDAAGFLSLTRKGIDEDFVPDVPAAERAIVYATQGTMEFGMPRRQGVGPRVDDKTVVVHRR